MFLRRVEHRIQYLDDQQTHIVPTDDADLAWLARSMGSRLAAHFCSALDTHREAVATEFDRLLGNVQDLQWLRRRRTTSGDTLEQQLAGLARAFS